MKLDDYVAGVVAGERRALARALTLVESRRPDHRALARQLLERLLPRTGGALRLGVTGAPGVGKSTLIEALGLRLVEEGRRVAVLAVDPTSQLSGGSLLGDKTRMERLSQHPLAFIRPSPSGGALGGVARSSRRQLLLCEAAGYQVVMVETVGVGQSETAVAHMVDTFLWVTMPGAGDEVQGIKRGITELADIVAVNKADRAVLEEARRARSQLLSALALLTPPTPGWRVPVVVCSALEGSGIEELWQAVADHRRHLEASGLLAQRRAHQALYWMEQALEEGLRERFYSHPRVAARLDEVRAQVAAGTLPPESAAEQLLAELG